jgi:YVTN family beta-propeller protein
MSKFNNRYLKYSTNTNDTYADYGEVVSVISDKIVNLDMGGTGYILEAVNCDNSYIPKLGDWATVEWRNGQPLAKGGTSMSTGLRDINDNVTIISTSDIASGVVNSDHIRTNTIEARHITAESIQANHISANSINANHITANAITTVQLSANSITTDKIQAGAIQAQNIQAGAIGATQISANSINATHITANAIQTQHISANAIQAGQISANAIQTQHISANTITASQIKVDAINASHISANSITSSEISANAIQSVHISSNAINSNHINAGTINSGHISANAIQSQHISANSIDASHIKAGVINATLISANAVQAQHISAGSITSTHISANAIQSQHISANSIQTNHISANSITASKISSDSIFGYHIVANNITASHITANAIQAQHISANSVQSAHISAGSINAGHIVSNAIQSNHISANSIQASHITANAIQTQHISANTIVGSQIKADTISGNHITANTIQGKHIQADTISGNHITANSIDTKHVKAGSITATQISANSITSSHISANSVQSQHISANSIQSSHISANSINAGHIIANSIQSSHISANSIQSGHISANSIQTQHISANTITGGMIKSNEISGNHIQAGSVDTDHLTVGSRKEGLLGQYFTYNSASGNSKFQVYKGSQIDPTINFSWGTGSPAIVGQNDSFSVRWQGFIYAPETGTYSFHLTADDLGKVVVNNTVVVNQLSYSGGVEQTGTISLTQGNWYPFLAEMTEGTSGAMAIVKWTKPSLVKEVVPSKYYTQGNTVIDGQTITTGSITASAIQAGTITAQSGILANAVIQTANIADGAITNAKIGNAEIKTANIASGNITNALIQDATIQYAKIASVNADTITVGKITGTQISGSTIEGQNIKGNTISGNHIVANSIDSLHIKAGAITTTELSAQSITSDKIQAGSITADSIRVGSIRAEHISTVGLDANIVSVYNPTTGQTLIGGGYLRVDGLDVGVVQSDNLVGNGLFLTASSAFGSKRDNPYGEVLLGNTRAVVGGNQVWKINVTTGQKVQVIDIPSSKPADVSIHPSGNYAYVTVQGDDTVAQIDLATDLLTTNTLSVGKGPNVIKWVGMKLMDMKHFLVLNRDPDDMNVPDTLNVIDSPPTSVNADLYVHHFIPLGNGPYDLVVDDNMQIYVTMADDGDIVVIDASAHDSSTWKVKGRLPISAYGTDNYHGGLPANFGLNEVTGGDASYQYNDAGMAGMVDMPGMSHSHGGYGTSDGSLKTYQPHGIALSSDPNHLYVVDNKNGELVVVDKLGNAPYNALIGTSPNGSFSYGMDMHMDMSSGGTMPGMDMGFGPSPEHLKEMGIASGGGPGTYHVRYRIPVGDSPDFIEIINGKIFVTLEGTGDIAIIDEQKILDEIALDKAYYGNFVEGGVFEKWNVFQPMRDVNAIPVRTISVGSKPSFTDVANGKLFVSLSGQNQVAVINPTTETVTQYINTGANPKGFAFTPDNQYMYVANFGGSGDLSMVYPKGEYIGDAFLGLEGGVVYQGAEWWTPDRSDWVYDASGNVKSRSTVEFRINEPFLNEGGYAKLTTFGKDYQYAQIEQDIYNVSNYSNGDNKLNVKAEKLIQGTGTGNIFYPRNEWLNSPVPSNINIGNVVSGSTILTPANPSKYTIYYGQNARIEFSANTLVSGNWIEADYTCKNDIYFKPHNGSALVAIENGSSPNFNVTMEIDEFVPKFVVYDNQLTATTFTPTADGINQTYTGLEYSTITNRALGMTVTSSVAPTSGGALSKIVDGGEVMSVHGDNTANPLPSSTGTLTFPSGNQWVKVDLGKVYMVGMIQVAHSYGLDRVYQGTKTEVSEDGVTWTTIYDSAVSGTYSEKISYHAPHNHTHYAKTFTFGAKPVRYVRDWANGWKSGDGLTSGSTNNWTEIQVFGDWELEKGYTYPANSELAGQQIATNGKGFVSTDISKAYIAVDIPIEYTTWWYMSYIVGPDFGRIKIDMPTAMGGSHFLELESPFVNKVAHRHIMPFTPSQNIKANDAMNIKAGKHRAVIMQDSGRVTVDRLRFEDYQYLTRSSLLIPSQSTSTIFRRNKLVAEQAKWYQGMGVQSTEGAFDKPRVNPDTGIPDKSVPIKYRMRFRTELNANGTIEERGTAYFTSAIFETGKLSTHWRRSESVDSYPAHKIEKWDGNQPHKTGIQHDHLANGAVRGTKIMPNTIMDWHISNYARIQEHKLELNHPTHAHGKYQVLAGQGPMGTDLYLWKDNSDLLNSMDGWAGTSGNYGTGNTVSRGDHKHDDLYLSLATGGVMKGHIDFGPNNALGLKFGSVANGAVGYIRQSATQGQLDLGSDDLINFYESDSNTLAVSISTNGKTLDAKGGLLENGVALSSKYAPIAHVGSGGSAHAVAVSGGANGFIDGANYGKLLRIQDNAINQTTADGRYIQLNGSTGILSVGGGGGALSLKATSTDHIYMAIYARSGNSTRSGWFGYGTNGNNTMQITNETSGNINISTVGGGLVQVNGSTIWTSANFDPSTKSDTTHVHAVAISGGANGFMSGSDKAKLDGVATNANNYSHPTGDGNLHVPATSTTNSKKVLTAGATAGSLSWANVDYADVINKPTTFTPSAHTHTASNITDLYSNIYTKTEVDTAVSNAGDIKAGQANIFTNTNTFNKAGLGIKIQPSSSVANSTKLFQINNATSSEVFSVNYSGGVVIAGDFTVTGQQIISGTTNVNGDYTISGQLIVGGNSTLGDASTDVTTVNGTLKVQNGSIQEIGKYNEVHRRPIYGIGGDLQFQTDSTVFDDITDYYDLSSYALPTVQAGATRYYRLYVVYSDDITSAQQTGGQKATIRIAGATNKDLDLPITFGLVNGRRDWFSAYFTDLPTGNGKIQAKLALANNNLGIRWIELVAYDKF